ncbi:hypothetical protein P5673_018533, partial [Acropora cervicornis]
MTAGKAMYVRFSKGNFRKTDALSALKWRKQTHHYDQLQISIPRSSDITCSSNGQICDKLSKNPWLPYDVSLVDKVPGIYVIGEKKGSETKYLYAGRSDDVRRRLQEHRIQKQQDIDKRVAGKFKKHKETDLRMKYVSERRQKSKEGEYMQCLKKKIGYRPELNKREGDGCASCVAGQKESHAKRSAKHSSSRSSPRSPARPKVASPGRSASSSKILSKRSSRTSSGSKISPGPSFRSSGRPKVSKRLSFRSSGSTKVSSAPEFFLHHAFIDKIWDDWQKKSSAHKNTFFPTVKENMPETILRPAELIDLSNQPGHVSIAYEPFKPEEEIRKKVE